MVFTDRSETQRGLKFYVTLTYAFTKAQITCYLKGVKSQHKRGNCWGIKIF
jgi:hypothetical protein